MDNAKLEVISSHGQMNDVRTIYADYQATTPVDPRVHERMAQYWGNSFGNPHSSDHVVGWQACEAVQGAAASIAAAIGADTDEIIFTSGATEANNLALFGLARRAPPGRNRILVSAVEHKCVLASSSVLASQEGFAVELIPVHRDGMIDLSALKATIDEKVLVVSVMAVNNEVGTIQNMSRISEILSPQNIPLHCDAAQAPCAMDVGDLTKHADLISLSAHKMYGPQGIGALFIRRELHDGIEPMIYGGGQQNYLRSGTLPLPLCAGMGAAFEFVTNTDSASERRRIALQRDRFIRLLIEGGARVVLNGPTSTCRHPGNANLRFDGYDAHSIIGKLQPLLAASTGAACASGLPESSHVLHAIGLTTEESNASIRFSFGRFTTDEEIKTAAGLVLQALQSASSAMSR